MAKRTLSLYLLKSGVAIPEGALAAPATAYGVKGLAQAKLFVRRTLRDEPEWLAFLRPHLTTQPPANQRKTSSLSALLVFKARNRWFALAFGYGRMLLDPEMIVSDFGLRAALNSVDPDELRSIDAKTLEELTVLTRRQLSKGASITSFELDLNRDLVKAVRGRSKDNTFADQVSGSDALRLTSDLAFSEIGPRARAALKLYKSNSYKSRFAWIDHVQLVTDPTRERQLDLTLQDVIEQNEQGAIYLAAPTIIDEDDFGGFRLLRAENELVFDLRWEEYLALKRGTPSLASLRNDRIAAISAASGEPRSQWPVYRTLVVEFDEGGIHYVLSGGDWFEVEQNFAQATRNFIANFETDTPDLPSAGTDEKEGTYNRRACRQLRTRARLLDQVPFRATQSQDSIEFCDILLKPNKIIHVKRKSGSSTLSHLFSQGIVSGELLHFDEGFRNGVRARLARGSGFTNVIPPGPLQPQNFEIVYAVISAPARGNRHYLPFFSQVNFQRAVEQLGGRGYRVSLSRVDVA